MESDLVLRPATRADLDGIAAIHQAARTHAEASFPAPVHDSAEVAQWVAGWDLDSMTVWVAEQGDVLVAYARFTQTWLDDLYVHPDHQRLGVGSALLEAVKAQRPDGFGLWVFETNRPAQDFYLAHALVRLERTDGSGNEEHAPDERWVWPGTDSLAGLRRLIDEVDDELGGLLARRAALTRGVQQVKRESGVEASRDPDREAEVAARVGAKAPELGVERAGRIMDVIIAESIAAGGDA